MGLLAPMLGADAGLSRALDDRYYGPPSDHRIPAIDAEGAMSVPAVYACTALISEDMGKSPMGIFEDLGEGGHRPAPQHPVHELIHDQPNEIQTALEFREMMTAFAILRGKGIAEIHNGRRGPVDSLEPLHPDLVREERTGSRLRYIYRDPRRDFEERTLLTDEVYVLRGRLGRSVIDFGRSLILTALRRQMFDNLLFQRGAKHQGVITAPKLLSDPTRKALRTALDEYSIEGPRAGRPLLLEEGMDWKQVSITPKDLELLGLAKFTDEQIAGRLFRVPPHKIGALERATNNNIEQQSVDYVTDTLLGWAVRWEQSTRRDLIIARDRFFAKLNLDAMMRGDITARFEAYALAVQWGWATRNEVRRREDWNPLPGLDEPLTPMNMTRGEDGATAVSYGAPRAADPTPSPLAVSGHLRLFASDAASRVVRRELAAMHKLAERSAGDPGGWRAGVDAFYAEHADHVATALHLPQPDALRYAREQRTALLEDGPTAMDDWLVDRVSELVDLAIEANGESAGDSRVIAFRQRPSVVHVHNEAAPAPITVSPVINVPDRSVEVPVNVHVPPANVYVEVPESAAPVVNVHPEVHAAAPVVNNQVTVEAADAAPAGPQEIRIVEMPTRVTRRRVTKRTDRGSIAETEDVEEDES